MKKPLSNDEYIESALVGVVLTNPNVFPEVSEIVKAQHFSVDSAFKCWAAIEKHWNSKDNSDLQAKVYIELPSETDKAWFFSATGDQIHFPSKAASTARQVYNAAKRRRLEKEIKQLGALTKDATQNPDFILEGLASLYRKETGTIGVDASIGTAIKRFSLLQEKNRQKGFLGKRTGFELLQNDFIVYQPGHLWVVGAWTSVGKSAFMIEAINRFFNEDDQGRVVVFSTEMTEEQNIARILANRTGVNANVILSGNMLDRHRELVSAHQQWLETKNMHIYTKAREYSEIVSQLRKIKHGCGVDLVFIDFIQNVYKHGVSDNYAMMSSIAKDMQALAHDIECTIVCLSQLPNHAGREDTGILEFKGAGEIAAACDVGILMKRAKEDNSKILFDVRKNRHGKCGKYVFQFANKWTRIEEVEAI